MQVGSRRVALLYSKTIDGLNSMENYGMSMRARALEFMMCLKAARTVFYPSRQEVFLPDKLFANKRQTAPNLANAISTCREAPAVPAGLEKSQFSEISEMADGGAGHLSATEYRPY
jgi:hypothetical protein